MLRMGEAGENPPELAYDTWLGLNFSRTLTTAPNLVLSRHFKWAIKMEEPLEEAMSIAILALQMASLPPKGLPIYLQA